MIKFTIALLIFIGPLGYGVEDERSMLISDVDFTHLQTAPSLTWGFNPFSRKPGYVPINPSVDEVSPAQFKLSAIIYDSEDPLAIINGETVGVGDEIGDLEVETVAPNYVVIKDEKNRIELTLGIPKKAKQRAMIRPYVGSKEQDE